MSYPYKTEPFEHQRVEFEQHWDTPNRALWWEMGCAKTKPIIDTIGKLYLERKITGALILAPKAVAPNWERTEIPIHLPDEVREKTLALTWRGDKATTQRYQRMLERALAHDGLLVVCMSYDAIMTELKRGARRVPGVKKTYKGAEFAKALLDSRDCLMCCDESARIKSPDTKRSRRVLKAGKLASFRRVLTGTPIANSPLDVFNQLRFLDPEFWHSRGCRTFSAFKNTYATYVEHLQNPQACPHDPALRPNCGCPKFPMLIGYKNLDDLGAAVAEVGSRHLKDEVLAHLPPRLYDRRYFTLSAEQARVYSKLRDEFMVEWQSGDITSANLAIVRLLRFQEITSGYLPSDLGEVVDFKDNERPNVLREIIEDCPHQMIIWAKFRRDFEIIAPMLDELEVTYGVYQGSTSHDERERIRDEFQAGKLKVFLANPACAGEGLTLTNARTVVYYNNTYSLTDRLQSEARAHRPGQEHPVQYIDIVAEGTVDEKILTALRDKKDISNAILGDSPAAWI